MRSNTARSRRGLAMMLILISLMVATILTSAYLASRDNSAMIGENVSEAAASRWAAQTGLEMGLAILQTETDWRSMHDSGTLLRDYPLGSGLLDITVKDLITNSPPGVTAENIQITATARVDGISQAVSANVYVPVLGKVADVDMSEFAIYGADQIVLAGNSTVARWPRAPMSVLGRPVLIGTRASSSSRVSVAENAAAIDSVLYHRPDASTLLLSNATSRDLTTQVMPDIAPWPQAPGTSVSSPPAIPLYGPLGWAGGLLNVSSTLRGTAITLTSGARRTLTGTISLISDSDLTITDSKLVVNGQVKIVVFDDLELVNGAIEVSATGRLSLFVGGDVRLLDSYIGEVRSNNTRDNTGYATAYDPERIKIFRIPGETSPAAWSLEANSVVKANVYAPLAAFSIEDDSALYGRAAAQSVSLSGNAAVFYDHRLDRRAGYTTFDGPLYENDGSLKSDLKTLLTLDTGTLSVVASTTNLLLENPLDERTTLGSAPPADTLDVPETEPTPRPVKIEYAMVRYGPSVSDWESHATP